MRMSYFYGTQADQFNFIRIPKELVVGEAFASLSVQAKILYGMLLDRMGCPIRINGWMKKIEFTSCIRWMRFSRI